MFFFFFGLVPAEISVLQMGFGSWWRKNVIEKVHAASYSGKYTINNPWLFNAVKVKSKLDFEREFPLNLMAQAAYVCIPVVLGMGIMASVTEGGYFHQGERLCTTLQLFRIFNPR